MKKLLFALCAITQLNAVHIFEIDPNASDAADGSPLAEVELQQANELITNYNNIAFPQSSTPRKKVDISPIQQIRGKVSHIEKLKNKERHKHRLQEINNQLVDMICIQEILAGFSFNSR